MNFPVSKEIEMKISIQILCKQIHKQETRLTLAWVLHTYVQCEVMITRGSSFKEILRFFGFQYMRALEELRNILMPV